MTDEEMARKWVIANTGFNPKEPLGKIAVRTFLAGLKAGKDMAETDLATVAYMQGAERYKPKWHKVADGDLPKNTRYVWTNIGPSYYDDDRDCPCWRDEFGRTQGVIAWCEPKFKGE